MMWEYGKKEGILGYVLWDCYGIYEYDFVVCVEMKQTMH